MGVSGKDKIYTATFENGHDMLAHFDELAFAIRIVGALGVRRVVKEGD